MTVETLLKKLQAGGHFAMVDSLCEKCLINLVAGRHAVLLTDLCGSATNEKLEEREGGYVLEFVLADILRINVANLSKSECKCFAPGSVAH